MAALPMRSREARFNRLTIATAGPADHHHAAADASGFERAGQGAFAAYFDHYIGTQAIGGCQIEFFIL